MTRLRIITWNVLHRIHGEKWSKHVVRAFPEERVRIARIAERVAAWVQEPSTVVCLQEVSGDQLAALTGAVSHRYSRVPKWWKFWSPPLKDASEHLAILASGAIFSNGLTFSDDDGKGLLVADVQGVRIVNAHLTFGPRGTAQLKQLATFAQPRTVLAGDFNADREMVGRTLGAGFTLADAAERTRAEGARLRRGYSVDHLAVTGGALESVEVLESDGLSDHHALSASARFD